MSERSDLLEELQQHYENLAKLRVQRANFGVNPPLDLENTIQQELDRIKEIEQRLDSIATSSPPPSSKAPPMPNTAINGSRFSRLEQRLDTLVDLVNEVRTDQVRAEVRYESLQARVIELEEDSSSPPFRSHSLAAPLGTLGLLLFSITLVLFLLYQAGVSTGIF